MADRQALGVGQRGLKLGRELVETHGLIPIPYLVVAGAF
jgi:hypothetical protein